ncbi:MAG TPA: choice-of-anchor Q domain-containing protein [Gaiellales bacterium]|nr:choice-of-anchor Q domain-containing protein [Gaiellales bacterium]
MRLLVAAWVVIGLFGAAIVPGGVALAQGAPPPPTRPAPRGPLARPTTVHTQAAAMPALSATAPVVSTAAIHSTFVVDTAGDPTTGTSCAAGHPAGTCSLREAVAEADADTGNIDAITIPSGMTVTLTQGVTLNLTNSMVVNGTGATVNGEGAEVFDQYNSPAVQMTGLTITGGMATGDGGGIYCSNGTLNLVSVHIIGNVAANGGGIYTQSDCQLWISNSVFQSNVATGALAVSAQAGDPVYARGNGGGLYTYGSAVITGSTFGDPNTNGTAGNLAEEGAGIYNYDGDVTIQNSVIERNSSPSTFGYGVGVYNDEVMDISGSKIDYNSAPYGADGVGIDVEYTTQITNTEINYNTASGASTTYGGGMYDDGDTTTLTNVTFTGNKVNPTGGESVYGGALLSYAYNLTYTGGTVSNQSNGAAGESDYVEGGALYLDGSHATVKNVTISNTTNNSGPNEYPEGGAIYINEYAELQNVTIIGTTNTGYDVYGGAIYNDDYSTLTGVKISNTSNHATYSSGGYIAGGAIYNDGENMTMNSSSVDATTNLADTGSATPSDNSSEIDGGVFYNDYESTFSAVSMTNTKDTASGGAGEVYGGGFYNDESVNLNNVQVVNTTVQADSYVEGGLWYNDDRLNATNFTVGGATVKVLGGPMAGTPYADGALMYNDSQANVINGTFDNVTATVPAAGDNLWMIENADLLQLTNTTIANDSMSGPAGNTFLVYAYGSSQLGLRNSIVASTTPALNCGGASATAKIISAGHNLDSGNSCGFTFPGDKHNVNPMVAALANNGGAVQTGAISFTSPAILAAANCPTTDARGVRRPASRCDAGAYELTPWWLFP